MTEEKSVGKFEVWVLRGIGAIITTYLGGDLAGPVLGLTINMPDVMAWTLLGLIISYFLNRIWIKFEHFIDAQIIIMQLRWQSEKDEHERRLIHELGHPRAEPTASVTS
jgi:hypothetical protein